MSDQESSPEVYMFPISNEQGFRVVDGETYMHMINTIVNAQVELMEEFPNNPILVVYETSAQL